MFGDKKKHTTPVTRRCFYTHCLRPCTTITEETCLYHYWVGNIGKTVRVTKGAFAGAWGRLNVVNVTQGRLLLAQHPHPDIPTPIWVNFDDLTVVETQKVEFQVEETTWPKYYSYCTVHHSVCRDPFCPADRPYRGPKKSTGSDAFAARFNDLTYVYYVEAPARQDDHA